MANGLIGRDVGLSMNVKGVNNTMILSTLLAILDEAKKPDGSLDKIRVMVEGLLKHTKVKK